MSLRFLAPAGTRITFPDLAAWLGGCLIGSDGAAKLADEVQRRYEIPHLWLMSSGRAAMTLILRTLSQLAGPERDEVVVPAYTCYSVGASAILAGLKVRPVDIDPATLSYEPTVLANQDFSRVLAIISGNLYGIPNDLPFIEELCRKQGVFMIDDAAQCLHARIADRYVGTFGDVGIYSLDKGKNITSIQGGIIVSRNDTLHSPLAMAVKSLPAAPRRQTFAESVKLLAYAILLRPWLYWLPQRTMTLGETIYEIDYPVTCYSPSLGNMAARLFQRIDQLVAHRRLIAESIIKGLQESNWQIPNLSNATAVYPRLPILANSADMRDQKVIELQAAGIGASGSYPLAIPDVLEIRPHLASADDAFEGARSVAQRILTLPTHGYVTDRDVKRILNVIRNA